MLCLEYLLYYFIQLYFNKYSIKVSFLNSYVNKTEIITFLNNGNFKRQDLIFFSHACRPIRPCLLILYYGGLMVME